MMHFYAFLMQNLLPLHARCVIRGIIQPSSPSLPLEMWNLHTLAISSLTLLQLREGGKCLGIIKQYKGKERDFPSLIFPCASCIQKWKNVVGKPPRNFPTDHFFLKKIQNCADSASGLRPRKCAFFLFRVMRGKNGSSASYKKGILFSFSLLSPAVSRVEKLVSPHASWKRKGKGK